MAIQYISGILCSSDVVYFFTNLSFGRSSVHFLFVQLFFLYITDHTLLPYHLGHATNTKYKMGENEINQVTEEKDLEVLIDDKLKFQQHINQQTKKANQRLGMIKRSFSYMEKEMFITLLHIIL
jgi:hypothetical protein